MVECCVNKFQDRSRPGMGRQVYSPACSTGLMHRQQSNPEVQKFPPSTRTLRLRSLSLQLGLARRSLIHEVTSLRIQFSLVQQRTVAAMANLQQCDCAIYLWWGQFRSVTPASCSWQVGGWRWRSRASYHSKVVRTFRSFVGYQSEIAVDNFLTTSGCS